MDSIRRILVAIKDPQQRPLAAVAKAAQLAQALKAEVCLFHALVDPIYLDVPFEGPSTAQIEAQNRAAHLARLEPLARSMTRRHIKVTTAVEWDYPTYEAVIRAALRFDADLIIAESHAGRHAAPWLLHFTDWELARLSSLPVLLIKNARPYRRPNVLAAVDPGRSSGKPDPLDGEILRYGAQIATALHGALHAVYAYDPLPKRPADLDRPAAVAKAQAEASSQALAAVDRELKPLGVSAARRHVEGGFAIDVIEKVADDIHAALLAIGVMSRSGLKGLLIGSTAGRMLDRMSCDFLIVKQPGSRSRIAATPRGVRFVQTPL